MEEENIKFNMKLVSSKSTRENIKKIKEKFLKTLLN